MIGEEVIIAKDNKPVVKVVGIAEPGNPRARDRPRGKSGWRPISMRRRTISRATADARAVGYARLSADFHRVPSRRQVGNAALPPPRSVRSLACGASS